MIAQGRGAVRTGMRASHAARDAVVLIGVALAVAAATVVGWEALAIVGGLAVLLVVGAWLQYRSTRSREWLLLAILGGVLLLPMVGRLTGINLLGIWQMGMLAASALGVSQLAGDMRRFGWLRAAVLLFGLSLALAAAASWAGRTRPVAGLYQLFSDLKPLLLIALGYALRWDERSERWLWPVVKYAWIPMLLLVLMEWAAPGAYFKLLYRGVGVPSPDPTGMLPSRAIGPFEHPSFLATVAAWFALLCMARACNAERGRGAAWALLIVPYFVLIVCGVQRQEMAACALALAVIALASRPDRLLRNLVAIAVVAVPLVAAFLLVFADNIEREISAWGIGSATSAIEIPRAQLFVGAFWLASRYFPLGSGLGTYAGAGAEKFDTSLYYALGFKNYWWFGKEDYLMDTYWPNPIAEIGFIGAGLLLLSYLAFLWHAVSRAGKEAGIARTCWLGAAGMMAYTLCLSGSSPAFQDPRLFIVPAVLFGMASYQSWRGDHAQR